MARSAVPFALILLSISAFADEPLRVGDDVELSRGGSAWVPAKIESISGTIVKVRYGPNKYDFQNVQAPSPLIRKPGTAAREAADNQLRESFRKDASKYQRVVAQFAPFYDPKYIG